MNTLFWGQIRFASCTVFPLFILFKNCFSWAYLISYFCISLYAFICQPARSRQIRNHVNNSCQSSYLPLRTVRWWPKICRYSEVGSAAFHAYLCTNETARQRASMIYAFAVLPVYANSLLLINRFKDVQYGFLILAEENWTLTQILWNDAGVRRKTRTDWCEWC